MGCQTGHHVTLFSITLRHYLYFPTRLRLFAFKEPTL